MGGGWGGEGGGGGGGKGSCVGVKRRAQEVAVAVAAAAAHAIPAILKIELNETDDGYRHLTVSRFQEARHDQMKALWAPVSFAHSHKTGRKDT